VEAAEVFASFEFEQHSLFPTGSFVRLQFQLEAATGAVERCLWCVAHGRLALYLWQLHFESAFGWTGANAPGRLALSKVMQSSIAAFVRTGNPNNGTLGVTWDQWTPSAPLRMQFDASLQQATVSEQ
jgi:Carboxylesterase family